jgi:two-component system, OmpR family, phosphate regulon sensor histidine kinase PhoR
MRRQTLVQVWLSISVAVCVILLLSARPVGATASAIAVGVATGAFGVYAYLAWRRLARYLRRLEDYAALLPSNEMELPDSLPPEFAMLSSALRRASQHVGSVIDRANLELARRETILAGMAEGVLAVDRDLRVTFSNEAFANAFQTRRPLQEGRPLYEVVREPALREILEEVLATGNASRRRLHLPAAGGRWFEIHALALGHLPQTGVIAVLHDITDIQRQEQARKDFVANVSHELRTPLAAIRGYAETLLDGALDDSQINRKFVEVIQAHAIRLNNIAQDLLVLSELDTHAAPTAPTLIRVQEVIEAALRTVEGAANMRNVSLHVHSCDRAFVLGSRLRLEQIVVNLLDNAVKFNRPSGSITIDCRSSRDQVELAISDTGIGIPSEDLNRIFERFYRVDKARSREAGGTGLGLSIVKELLEEMGGSIAVESQLGQGSRFFVRMPAASAESSSLLNSLEPDLAG